MEGPAGGWAAWWRGMNTNVRWALLQAAGAGVADSVWTTTVVSSFLYVLADKSNTAVGAIEAVQGMTTLLIALPMGMVADRWSKAGVIRIGGVFAILATLCMSTVVVLASDKEEEGANSASVKRLLFAFGGCACLWGVTDAVTQGPVPALFADSLPTGNRSRWYTYGFIANMAARTVGPAVSIAMFCICGDEWTLPEIRTVFLAGMAAELLLSAPTFFFFDDSKALGSEAAPLTESLLADLEGAEGDDEAPHDDGRVIFGRYCVGRFLNIKPRHIPYIMFCKDVLVAFGSGMTVKFFPLFWKEEVGLSPAEVQGIYLLVPIAIASFSGVGVIAAKRIGRVFTMLAVRASGLSCLVLMVILRQRVHPIILIGLYLMRTGLMNSTYPLEESVLMDFVPSKSRARWKSLQSVTAFGWCGSAAVGGWLGDRHGYAFTFLITAALQGLGSSLIILIAHLVPLEVETKDVEESGDGPQSPKSKDGRRQHRQEKGHWDGHSYTSVPSDLTDDEFFNKTGAWDAEPHISFPHLFSPSAENSAAGDSDDEYLLMEGDPSLMERSPRSSMDEGDVGGAEL